jgi:hypothetical protein
MDKNIDVNSVYVLSDDVVMRKIEGETIIVPIATGIGDLEVELYTVNDTGDIILSMLDCKKTFNDIIHSLSSHFEVTPDELKADVTGFANELYRRKILVENQ